MTQNPTPAQVALVRRRYLERATVRAIVSETGVTLDNIYRCLAGQFADDTGIAPAPIPRRRPGMRIRGRHGSRTALVARMWRTAERQVEEIEQRLKAAGLEPGEREGNARTLAILVKTLRELAAFDEEQARRGRKTPNRRAIDGHDDPVPTDIDEFRRELARRIDALAEARGGDATAGGAGPGPA